MGMSTGPSTLGSLVVNLKALEVSHDYPAIELHSSASAVLRFQSNDSEPRKVNVENSYSNHPNYSWILYCLWALAIGRILWIDNNSSSCFAGPGLVKLGQELKRSFNLTFRKEPQTRARKRPSKGECKNSTNKPQQSLNLGNAQLKWNNL